MVEKVKVKGLDGRGVIEKVLELKKKKGGTVLILGEDMVNLVNREPEWGDNGIKKRLCDLDVEIDVKNEDKIEVK